MAYTYCDANANVQQIGRHDVTFKWAVGHCHCRNNKLNDDDGNDNDTHSSGGGLGLPSQNRK